MSHNQVGPGSSPGGPTGNKALTISFVSAFLFCSYFLTLLLFTCHNNMLFLMALSITQVNVISSNLYYCTFADYYKKENELLCQKLKH